MVAEAVHMATVTLKNVPAELLSQLKDEARRNRRSLNQEALLRLEASLGTTSRTGVEAAADLRRLHRRLKDLRPVTDEFLERAKSTGRP
jgi:hypothetical protein